MRPLIAANWKMHGELKWRDKPAKFDAILPSETRQEIDVLICPPFPLLAPIAEAAEKVSILSGAQTCHVDVAGAQTGEVSAEMIASVGATHVIVGHSERRAMGETDKDVLARAKAALRAGLIPIVCVGESIEQRQSGLAKSVVMSQIRSCCPYDGEYVVAYEPIWAIGTGKVPSIEDITAMHDSIRELVGDKVRILYGGSVKPANAEDIFGVENVNGALIGGASLEMDSLAAIASAALSHLE